MILSDMIKYYLLTGKLWGIRQRFQFGISTICRESLQFGNDHSISQHFNNKLIDNSEFRIGLCFSSEKPLRKTFSTASPTLHEIIIPSEFCAFQ